MVLFANMLPWNKNLLMTKKRMHHIGTAGCRFNISKMNDHVNKISYILTVSIRRIYNS